MSSTTSPSIEGRYQISYLLSPLIPADQAGEAAVRLIKAPVLAADGAIENEQSPALIPLAYPIRRTLEHKGVTFRDAYFGSYFVHLTPEAMVELDAALHRSTELVRYLVTSYPKDFFKLPPKRPAKVVAEKAAGENSEGRKEEEKKEESKISKIDQEIDALIVS